MESIYRKYSTKCHDKERCKELTAEKHLFSMCVLEKCNLNYCYVTSSIIDEHTFVGAIYPSFINCKLFEYDLVIRYTVSPVSHLLPVGPKLLVVLYENRELLTAFVEKYKNKYEIKVIRHRE